jgi:hypothetical protein
VQLTLGICSQLLQRLHEPVRVFCLQCDGACKGYAGAIAEIARLYLEYLAGATVDLSDDAPGVAEHDRLVKGIEDPVHDLRIQEPAPRSPVFLSD